MAPVRDLLGVLACWLVLATPAPSVAAAEVAAPGAAGLAYVGAF